MSRNRSGRVSHMLHVRERREIARGEREPPKIETNVYQAIEVAMLP